MLRQFMPHILMAASAAAAGFAASIRTAVADEIRLSGPYEHDNLALYFVHGKSAEGPVPLTLDEALARDRVVVHETGTVAELKIENTGEEDVLVHAGDIVKGGKQDRVVTTTFILKPKSGATPLAVFCVESGRWAARGSESVAAFASAEEMMPSREAKMAMKRSLAGHDEEFERRPRAFSAEREARRQAREQGESPAEIEQSQSAFEDGEGPANYQSEIWSRVGEIQDKLSRIVGAKVAASASESSLQLALENERLAKAQQAYVDALKERGETADDVVGLVFAVNGHINSADIYGSNGLFKKLWAKLLKASATEALSHKDDPSKDPAPSIETVQAFLESSSSAKEDTLEPVAGVKLKARETSAVFDSETESASGALLHRNVLAH